jgi:putative holliday junction resolvase
MGTVPGRGTVPLGCHNAHVRVLGVDIGRRRIGLAISDASGTLARPLRTMERGPSDKRTLRDLADLVTGLAAEEDGLGGVVVGLPVRLDGSPNELTTHVQAIVEGLRRRVAVPIHLQDERLSSHEADARLAVNERDWRVRKARLDSAAAAVILQDYLDVHATRPAAAEPVPEE